MLNRHTEQGIFDVRPIELDGFRLTALGVTVIGTPTIAQWEAAFTFASGASEASPYWIGELLNYAETRADYAVALSQAMAATGLAKGTLHNMSSMVRRVPVGVRAKAPSPSHTMAVSAEPPSRQGRWLDKARSEGWSVSELKAEMRASKRKDVIVGQAELVGRYRVFYAAPRWSTMPVEMLAKMPVAAHAAKDAVLFLWVPSTRLLANPGPRDVLDAWGFRAHTVQTWDRGSGPAGRFLIEQAEHLVIAERGSCPPDRPTPKPVSAYRERVPEDDETAKPHATRLMIEKMYDGPYCELFARQASEGWHAVGDDAGRWSARMP